MILNPSRKPIGQKPELEVISEYSLLEIESSAWGDLDDDLVQEPRNSENVHGSAIGRLPTIDEDEENLDETQFLQFIEVNKPQSRVTGVKGLQASRIQGAVSLPALRLTGEQVYLHNRQPSAATTPCLLPPIPINKHQESTLKTSRHLPRFHPLPMRTRLHIKDDDIGTGYPSGPQLPSCPLPQVKAKAHSNQKKMVTTNQTSIDMEMACPLPQVPSCPMPKVKAKPPVCNNHKKMVTTNKSRRSEVFFTSLEKSPKTRQSSTKHGESKLHMSGQQIPLSLRPTGAARKPISRP